MRGLMTSWRGGAGASAAIIGRGSGAARKIWIEPGAVRSPLRGFALDMVQQYEQGRQRPSGPASTLLRVIDADPEGVVRALQLPKAG